MQVPNKRQAELLDIIRERSSVSVNDLLPLFDVSAATIRKDLTLLEELRLVSRTHGEVHIAAPPPDTVTPIEHRRTHNIEAKRAIARAALPLVRPGMSVILDSGTTTLELARLLTAFSGLTVITNSMPAATVLAGSRVSVLLAGGMLLGENLSTQGPDAESCFSSVEADLAFLAATGIRPQVGVASQNPLEYSVKQAMLRAGRYRCVLADSTKFEKSGVHLYARFEELDAVITETGVPCPRLDELRREGRITWTIADEQPPQEA